MIIYVSMLLGIVIVILGKLNKVYSKADFSWKIFFKTNLIATLLNVVAGLFLLINQKEVIELFVKIVPSFPFVAGGLFSGILGISAMVVVQYLVDIFNPSKQTTVGLNK